MPGAAPLLGQVQVSSASFVAELNAVVGVALDAADDENATTLTVLGTLVCQHGAKLRVALFHVPYLLVIVATVALCWGRAAFGVERVDPAPSRRRPRRADGERRATRSG